jgi:hypothetical protein
MSAAPRFTGPGWPPQIGSGSPLASERLAARATRSALVACSPVAQVCEDIMFNYPGLDGTNDFMVRADLVSFTTRAGGGVVPTSSIASWGSLSQNEYRNNGSRIMRTILDRFAAPETLAPLT